MNKVILTGNLARDIELRATPQGTSVVSSCIAVSRDRKDQNGEYGTDFINFVAWQQQADYLNKYAQKGDRLEIVGRWQVRKYNDRNGLEQTSNEVVVESVTCFSKEPKAEANEPTLNLDTETIPDDDLPF